MLSKRRHFRFRNRCEMPLNTGYRINSNSLAHALLPHDDYDRFVLKEEVSAVDEWYDVSANLNSHKTNRNQQFFQVGK